VPTARWTFEVQDITEGERVKARVRTGRFTFFRLRINESLRWLDVHVAESRFSRGTFIHSPKVVCIVDLYGKCTRALTCESSCEGSGSMYRMECLRLLYPTSPRM
jgi:hypothetical protein